MSADLLEESFRADSAQPGAAGLTAVIAGSVLASLDLFVVNLAFPVIETDFPGTSTAAMSWVLNAYSVLFAGLLIPSGRLADRFGHRLGFRLGLLTFGLGSLISAAAPNVAVLIAGRGVQGAAAALLVPTSLGLLLTSYPKQAHRRMVGVWAASGSVAAALGPVLGGVLVGLNWRLIFAINVPIAAIGLAASRRLMERSRTDTRLPDLVGCTLIVIGIIAIVTVLSYLDTWGPTSSILWALVVLALLSLAAAAVRCRRAPSPAIDLSLFRIRSFTAATIGMTSFYVGFSLMLLGGSLFLIQVWHYSPVLAGLGFTVGPASAVVSSTLTGRVHLAPERLAVLGGVLFAVAGVLWALLLHDSTAYLTAFLPSMVLCGLASGITQTALLAIGTHDLPGASYGSGTGVINAARQVGAAVGVALLVILSGSGQTAASFRGAWVVMAVVGAVSTVTTLATHPRRPRKTVSEGVE